MWNRNEFDRQFKKCFARDIDPNDSVYAEIDLTVPFNYVWMVVRQAEISVLRRRDFAVMCNSHAIASDVSDGLAQLIGRFPMLPNDSTEDVSVYGGGALYALSNRAQGQRFATALLYQEVLPEELQAWQRKFRAFLNEHVTDCQVLNELSGFICTEASPRQERVVTRSTPIVDLRLPVRIRLAITECGVTAVGELLDLQEAELQRYLDSGHDEVKLQILELRNELMHKLV
jgi:hypothetical protein